MLQLRVADASNRNIQVNLKHRNTLKEIDFKKMQITANSAMKRKSQMVNNVSGLKFIATKRLEFLSHSSGRDKRSLCDSIEEVENGSSTSLH